MKKAIYPGTFDPVTNGHIDVLERACRLFDHVTVIVANNQAKGPLFSLEERIPLFADAITHIPNADVMPMKGKLTVDFARDLGAVAIIRGLRAVSDFEFEFQMAQMNRKLDEEVETIFLMPNEEYFFTSSNLVKHVARYELDRIASLMPSNVFEALKVKFSETLRD